MTGDEDERYFRAITVSVTERLHLAGYEPCVRTESIEIDASNVSKLASEAVGTYPSEWGTAPICVISLDSPPDSTFRSEEHFIPEGLGFSWTALPRGTGTCDRVNAAFSRYESEWLRQGLMGCFRPFFVAQGKDEAPAYYAPSKSEKVVWFTRDDTGRRVLSLGPDATVNLPDEAARGTLNIRVPRNQARTEWVSLALHKVALLTLWLCRGKMVFDPGFAPLREFLLAPTQSNFRSFCEEMSTGASPGVAIDFMVDLQGTPDGEKAAFELYSVQARMRVHHMRYGVVLLGAYPNLPDGLMWQRWRDPSEKPAETTPIQLGFEALRRITPTHENIAEAAYLRWVARGRTDGGDVEDWLDAERSLIAAMKL